MDRKIFKVRISINRIMKFKINNFNKIMKIQIKANQISFKISRVFRIIKVKVIFRRLIKIFRTNKILKIIIIFLNKFKPLM